MPRYCWIALLMIVLLSGCSYLDPKKYMDKQAVKKPMATRTDFTKALKCFGDMTQAYGRAPVFVTSSKVEDATGVARSSGGEIPSDATAMLQSSVVLIGGQVYYIANYPVLSANLLKIYGLPIPGQNKAAPKPQYYLDATISSYDRSIMKEQQGLGVDGEDGGAAADKRLVSSIISVDINMVRLPELVMEQRVQSMNSVEVIDDSVDFDADINFFGVGIGFDTSAKGIARRHQAVRALLDLGVMQSLGRLLNLPWWQCSPLHRNRDLIVVNNLRQRYRSWNKTQRIQQLQEDLHYRGFVIEQRNGKLNEQTVEAIQEFLLLNGRPISNYITEDLYLDVMFTVPKLDPTRSEPIQMQLPQEPLHKGPSPLQNKKLWKKMKLEEEEVI